MPSVIVVGDSLEVLRTMPEKLVHCCVTSPPYWGLRDYGVSGQIGLEQTPAEYIAKMVDVFREVRRVLRDDGTLWLNLGDSYAGSWGAQSRPDGSDANSTLQGSSMLSARQIKAHPRGTHTGSLKNTPGLKPKDLVGIPWRVALALQSDGWYLRSDIIWHKPNCMPSSVTDRPSTAHEYMFLLTKSERYYYDAVAVAEPAKVGSRGSMFTEGKTTRPAVSILDRMETDTRNRRTVWTIPVARFPGAHFATFPAKLVEPCILAGTSERGCCPHCGAPWRRLTAKTRRPTRPGEKTKIKVPSGWDTKPGSHGTIHREGRTQTPEYRDTAEIGNRDPQRHVTTVETIGWQQSCKCPEHSPIPCTVLDPFAGSGTTLAVARQHGRQGIGIELNPEYAAMAEQRMAELQPKSISIFDLTPSDN